jgi:Zn-dependent protease with chaperone function
MSANFVWLGAAVVLATYLAVSMLLAGAIAALAGRIVRRADAAASASRRANGLFLACVAPAVGGLVAALGFVLPAWLAHEPLGTDERVAAELLVAAGATLVLVARAARRAFVAERGTARAVSAWVRQARPVPLSGLDVPALRVDHDFPMAAVAGILRPRLLVSGQVLEALTPAELQAVAAHEAGHLASDDVLKRLLLRLCPDPLPWTRTRARLEGEWERAAEAAADTFARRRVSGVVLARALVKIAQMVPPGRRLALGTPAFAAGAPVAARVLDLLADEEGVPDAPKPHTVRAVPLLLAAAAGAAWLWSLPAVLPATHGVIESLVKALA